MLLIDEIAAIASDPENRYHAIALARPALINFLYFCYGNYELDLPAAALDRSAFGDLPFNNTPRADILAQEAGALTRIFGYDNPDLDRQKKVRILRDILQCCTERERLLLLHV